MTRSIENLRPLVLAAMLSVSSSACAQSNTPTAPPPPEPPVAAEPVQPVPPAPPTLPAPPAELAAPGQPPRKSARSAEATTRAMEERQRAMDEQQRGMIQKQRAMADREREMAEDAAARAKNMFLFTARTNSPEVPAIISTQALDAAAQAEWKEDLNVMDKILRDQMAQVGVDGGMRAMGIRLTVLGQSAPMYVEGCGVVFTSTVNWPLGPAAGSSGNKDDRTRVPDSPWERAKRELSDRESPQKPGRRIEPSPPSFDQAKLDDLVNALVKVLPQATNFRHLGENEVVFITIVGGDEAGNPLRLTLKAKKADIDQAARGQISPQDFTARVARRIG